MKPDLTKSSRTVLVACLALSCFAKTQAQTSYTFNHTGGVQSWTVPPCAGSMTIFVKGAAGGTGGVAGGNGGSALGVMTATAGHVFNIYVGGQGSVTAGGFNGGGNGGTSSSTSGAGGGGGSDVRLNGTAFADRIIVAAGGGGGGGNTTYSPYGGTGGGGSACTSSNGVGGGAGTGFGTSATNGTCAAGTAPSYASGGAGAGMNAGGGGGGQPSSTTGGYGCAGALGVGGDGGGTSYICGGATGGVNGGGGGGGGYYGGGGGMTGTGGGNGGGGGGSSWANGVLLSSTSFTGGNSTAHGQVIITYQLNGSSITATATPSTICAGQSVTLTASGQTSYTWMPVGTFAGSNSASVTDTPGSTTTYTVLGSNSVCTSSMTISIPVFTTVPTLTIINTASASAGVCSGSSVALTAIGAPTISWSGGVVNGATFAPTSTQTYVATGANACGTSSAATSISIHPQPTIVLTASQPTVCTTQSISLCPSGGVSYTMSPFTPTCSAYYPFSNQTYTVRGSSALGCTNSAMATVNVTVTPVIPPVSNPTLICIGGSATLSATGASNYSWTPFSPVVTTNSVIVNPTTSTTYSLTKWNGNCVSTDSVRLIVNPLPTVFAVANPTIVCASTPATLQAGGGSSYQWAPGNLPSGPGAFTIVVFPAQNTVYTVTASDGTCSGVGTVSVATNPNPTISILTSTNSMCIGQSATYTVSGATSYNYSNVPSTSPSFTATTGAVSPTTSTNYQVTGMNQFGCTSSTSQLLFVNGLPTITITKSSNLICPGFPATLTAGPAPGSTTVHLYSWFQGGNLNKSVVNPLTTSVYTVLGTNTVTSCQNTQTVTVNVFQPTFTTTPDTAICKGGNITLTASGASSYSWTGGPNPSNNVSFYNVSPTVLTVYSVTAKSTTNTLQCYSMKTISVDIYYQPTVTATPSRTQAICRNESVYLRGFGANTYYWQTVNQYGDSVQVFPIKETIYRVIGTDTYACKDTFDLLVRFSNCVGLGELTSNKVSISVFPNPNNGVFTVKAPFDLKLKLVNELGQVVRELSFTKGNSWSVDVKDLAPGAYFITGKHEDNYVNEKVMITR